MGGVYDWEGGVGRVVLLGGVMRGVLLGGMSWEACIVRRERLGGGVFLGGMGWEGVYCWEA